MDRLIYLESPDGRELSADFGKLCTILSPETCSCDECPLANVANSNGKDPCSRFMLTHPGAFFEKTGFKLLRVVDKPGCDSIGLEAEKPTRKSILEAAERCVCGDRDQQYGSPEASFEAIADLWGSYLWNKHDLGQQRGVGKNFISPEDVAAMMVLFKMARVATGSYKADSWIDAAGYAACGGEIGGNKQ